MKKIFLLFVTFIFSVNLFSQSSALVLSGGGAKGAYEVGIWKAMADFGLAKDVSVFSGTSVGSLNAALFACTTPSNAEKIWRNRVNKSSLLKPKKLKKEETTSDLMVVNSSGNENNPGLETLEESLEKLLGTLGNIMEEVANETLDYITTSNPSAGLYDRSELRDMIKSVLSVEKLNLTSKTVYATAVRKTQLGYKLFSSLFEHDYSHYFKLNDQPSNEIATDILLASSAVPGVYETQTLPAETVENGRPVGRVYEYLDGGVQAAGGRNTPIVPVLKHPEISTVYIVYLMSEEEKDYNFTSDELQRIEKSGKKFIEIYPSESLGNFFNGTIDFSPEKVAKLIDLGYSDGAAVFSKMGYFKVPPAFR